MSSHEVRAAGGVVIRDDRTPAQVLVVHRPDHADWSLPKGKLDPREKFREAAAREVLEETGVDVSLGPELASVEYTDRRGRSKIVRYWLMRPVNDEPLSRPADDEVDEVRWVTFGKALRMLTYPHDRELVAEAARSLLTAAGRRPVLLLRHGLAGDKSRWTGDDRLRPLTKTGRRQATALVAQLAPFGVARIITSPLTRCIETVTPTAKALGLEIVRDPRLETGVDLEIVRQLIRDVSDIPTILCSHGEVIGPVIRSLAKEGADLDGELGWSKASTWALTTDVTESGETVVRGGGHLAPPA